MMRASQIRWGLGKRLLGRITFAFLLMCSILGGGALGLLFVYQSDLPEVRALEDYRPNVVTELYSDEGQVFASFALQRRTLLTYEQIPPLLRDAVLVTEDQHFEEHWGVDLPRVMQAAWRNLSTMRKAEGASTLTMQLAGMLFLDRSDRSFRRKIQETLLAMQIERHYTKQQIFTLYGNQIYLAHGNYGFAAAAQFYFGKSVSELEVQEAALLAGLVRGPSYSPLLHPDRARARRNLVLRRMAEEGKITREQAQRYAEMPLGLNVQAARNDMGPYFVEEVRKQLERTFGSEAVHERGLRVYTTLNIEMQRVATRAVLDGLHAYDRRHGWRGGLRNILTEKSGILESFVHGDWRAPIQSGDYVHALVTQVGDRVATLRIGKHAAQLYGPDLAWTGRSSPKQLLKVGDLVVVHVREVSGNTAKVELEQEPAAQAALVAIENGTGEIKAMVGGYSFEESKFNRATQALRQVGSSFKPFVYATAIDQGLTPFDTIVDAPFTTMSGGEEYSPRNYDEKYEGTITLRRALAGSRNVPAVKLAAQIGIEKVVEMARRFGITGSLPPYLPLALGAAEISLIEQTSAFTVFPNEGIRIEPQFVRRVTTYDGALLEESKARVYDVIKPETAHTMLAMLRDVVEFGTAVRAKELRRPVAGKTGTTNDFSDAWFIGFTPSLTVGVWMGFDDNSIKLGPKETGSRAALPIWLQFMKAAHEGKPVEEFSNVEPLSKVALTKSVRVDTPDSAPTESEEEHSPTNVSPTVPKSPAAPPVKAPTKTPPARASIKPPESR
jgi:penicillin-binding protein 1A